MIVHLSAEAEHDLENIGDYIARDNPVRAVTFLQELRARCLALAQMPERFPMVPRYDASGLRRCGHGNYLILDRVQPRKVVVVHILHGAQDYASILFPS